MADKKFSKQFFSINPKVLGGNFSLFGDKFLHFHRDSVSLCFFHPSFSATFFNVAPRGACAFRAVCVCVLPTLYRGSLYVHKVACAARVPDRKFACLRGILRLEMFEIKFKIDITLFRKFFLNCFFKIFFVIFLSGECLLHLPYAKERLVEAPIRGAFKRE